ncbi:MAG: CDP-glycerol glycerophosphotransferase family protein [Candidatus Gracilibacteria bacterium]|nr:CDP-glycerol glycerophosphotransferase family protein [Candidatus Gracilibacteria bacterium]
MKKEFDFLGNLIKKISINLLFMLISYIIPKNNNLYIFGGNGGKGFSGNSKALFLYFKNKGKKVFYITNSDIKNLDPKFKNYFIEINNFKNYLLFLRAKYIFIDGMTWEISPLNFILGRFNIVNLWHGEPIKKIILSDKNYFKGNNFKKYIYTKLYFNKIKFGVTGNKNSKSVLNEAFNNDFKITGLPRNEVFFDKKGIFEVFEIKKLLNIDSYKKIIVYAPTWRDKRDSFSPFSNEFLEKLNDFLIANNYIFLVKGHLGTKNIDLDKKSNIKDISKIDFDIQELLKHTDILITDYSSIYIDFLLTKNPIIFYAFDLDKYLSEDRAMYYNYKDVILKNTLTQDEYKIIDIIAKIDKIIKTKKYIYEYDKLLDFFHKYKKGGYCKKIVSELDK